MSIQDYHAYTGHLALEAMRKRAERGLPNCRPPLGYRLEKTPLRSYVVVDPEAARFVRLAFAMVAAGNSMHWTLKELTSLGMRSQGDREIGLSSLWEVLHNPFYLGLVRHQGQLFTGGHEALVTEENFVMARRKLSGHCPKHSG